jgi:hypothetical protein
VRIGHLPLTLPPLPDAVTGKLAGVMTRAQVHRPEVALEIVHSVRDNHAQGRAGEVMVEGFQDFLRVELTRPVEIAQQLLASIHR